MFVVLKGCWENKREAAAESCIIHFMLPHLHESRERRNCEWGGRGMMRPRERGGRSCFLLAKRQDVNT